MNPFLTVMNFRVTFRTWLKYAKQKIKEENKLSGKYEDSSDENDNKKPHSVMIEIEKFYSCTSEEESD